MRRFISQLQVLALGLMWALAVPALSFAQATPIFPVSAEVATIKSDLLLWGAALIGVALAIYAFRRVRGLVR
jgi:hypothetical protein